MHEKKPRRNIGYWLNRTLIFGLFSFILFCILGFFAEEVQLSAEERVLVFAGLPITTDLPQGEFDGVTRSDFTIVEQSLRTVLPPGSSEAQVRAYIEAKQDECEDRDNDILCIFDMTGLPCRTIVTVVFSFSEQRLLEEINIRFGSICL